MRIKKFVKEIAVVMTVVLAISVSGCGKAKNNEKESTPNTSMEMSIGGLLGANNGFGLFMASQKGFFDKYNIKADIHSEWTAGAPMLEALPSGTWDVGWIGTTACNTGALEYGCTIIGVGGIDNTMRIFTRENSDVFKAGKGNSTEFPNIYGSAETLKGKTILCEKGTMHYMNLLMYLDAFGLSEEDVNIVHTDLQSAYQSFKAGQGDLISVCSPVTTDCITDGFACVETMEDINAAQPCMIIASSEYAQSHKDEVVAFLKACIDTSAYLNDQANKEECIEAYQKFQKEEVGVDTSSEECEMTLSQISWYSIEDMKKLAEKDENGKTGFENLYDNVTDYFVQIGKITAEDKDEIMNAVDPSYLIEAVAK